jgi:hypothetical protein
MDVSAMKSENRIKNNIFCRLPSKNRRLSETLVECDTSSGAEISFVLYFPKGSLIR